MSNGGYRSTTMRTRRTLAGLCQKCGVNKHEINKKQCTPCLDQQRGINNKRQVAAWDAALAHYGRLCECCGESHPLFLTLDHTDNKLHLDTAGRRIPGWRIANIAIKSGVWPTNLRTMCFNCNCGR